MDIESIKKEYINGKIGKYKFPYIYGFIIDNIIDENNHPWVVIDNGNDIEIKDLEHVDFTFPRE